MGFHKVEQRTADGDRYDRYQILAVADILEGKRPQYPLFRSVTFRTAPIAPPIKKRSVRIHHLSARSETGSVPVPRIEELGTDLGQNGDDESETLPE